MLDEYTRSLAQEYVAICCLMTDGAHSSAAEYQRLAADRSICHDELIRVLGEDYARPFDMLAWARRVTAAD